MPIYEYECEQCGKVEEVWQKMSDAPPAGCSHCSGKLHKLMSMNSFHLKGGGWYVTDYASKSKNTAGTSAKKEESAGTKTDGAADTSAKSADSTP
ncbi:MAG: zinc ribbon domain-containing protein [Desulfobacterales bacterium]